MITELILIVVGIGLIAGTYVFVAGEFSLVTVDRATVEREAAAGDARARSLLAALRSLSTQLSGAQVGITLTTLLLGFVMEPSLAGLLAAPLTSLGLAEGVADSVGVVLSLVVATVLSMVFGELVPKNVAIADPMATAKSVVIPLRASTVAFRPLIWALNGIANGVLRMFGVEPQEELRSARSSEELRSLVQRSAAQGTLERPVAGLLSRSISFGDRLADDVLTPRPQVVFLHSDATADTVISEAVRTGHSRFPVIGADADDVIGLVHLKRAVAVPPEDRGGVTARQLASEIPRIPGTLQLEETMNLLRERGFQLALVIDEYGGTAGILTLEDVVEELVGEITDEHDIRIDHGQRGTDGTWLLRGALRPDEIVEATGVALPESGDYETIAGLVMSELGRIPDTGDSVVIAATMAPNRSLGPDPGRDGDDPIGESDEDLPRPVLIRLTVTGKDRRRVDTVRLSAVSEDPS